MALSIGAVVAKFEADTSNFDKGLSKIHKETDAFTQGVGNAVNKVVTGFTVLGTAMLGVGGFGIKVASEMQMLRTNFDVLTGSIEKGSDMYKHLVEYANKTPFGVQDVAKATQTMLAFGVESEKSKEMLAMLGDISMGNSAKLGHLSSAFGQISSAGRLTGQDLLQLVNAGFNPLQIISEQTGESMTSLKKKMEDGAISVKMVEDAMKTATSEGGRFYDGTSKGAETLQGRFSTLKDETAMLVAKMVGLSDEGTILEGSLADLAGQIMDSLIPKIQELGKWFEENQDTIKAYIEQGLKTLMTTIETVSKIIQDLSKFYQEHKQVIDILVIAVGAIIAILVVLSATVSVVIGVMTLFGTTVAFLTSPITLVVIAIYALIAVGVLLWQNWDWITQKAGELGTYLQDKWEEIRKNIEEKINKIKEDSLAKWEEIKTGISDSVSKLKDKIVEVFTNVKDKIVEIIDDIIWVFENWTTVLGTVLGWIVGVFVFGVIAAVIIMSETMQRIFEAIPGIISAVWETLKTITISAFVFIKDFIVEKVNEWVEKIKSIPGIVGDIWKFLKDGIAATHEGIRNGINWIVDRFRELPGRTQSAVGDIWKFVMNGVGSAHNAVRDGVNWIVDRFRELPGRISGAISGMWNIGSKLGNDFKNGFLNAFSSIGSSVSSKLKSIGYATGGIVGGNSYSGDNVMARVNSGEMILNKQQQAQLFSMANGKGGGGGVTINVNNPVVREDNDIRAITSSVIEAINRQQQLTRLGI
jgi:tape measure domain-containing protein